jgi:glycosyltransferase involved in cell wall biosynthesis
MRFPTAISTLSTPSVWGPVAGGDEVPGSLLLTLGPRGIIHEVLRATTLRLVMAVPALREERKRFSLVIAATPATARVLEKELPGRVIVRPAIGSEVHQRAVGGTHSVLRLLYVGKLFPLKGLHFAIRALAHLHSSTTVRAVLTIVGDGHDIGRLRRLAKQLEISDCVRFVGPLPYRTTQNLYAHNDVFVFPSLHDSGGLVLLEAMAAGLPVVTLDLGGPSLLVTAESGIKVAPTTPSDVVTAMSSAFERLATNSTLRETLGKGAFARAAALSWSRIADELDDIYRSVARMKPWADTP